MGCVSWPKCFMLQTPEIGVVLNVRKNKHPGWVSVSRRRTYVANSLSTTHSDINMPLKEGAEFKSSFDEYIKVMESVRVDREKKKDQRGTGGHMKKEKDVAYNKTDPKSQKREGARNFKRFKDLAFAEGDESLEGSHFAAGKEGLGCSIRERNGVRARKEVNYAGPNVRLSENSFMGKTAYKSFDRGRNKSESADADDNEFDVDRFVFQPSEGINDGQRVTRMEMEERIQRLAKCLNDADINMPEWMFSKTMRSARIRFSDSSIMRIIQILGKLGNWRRVLQVVEWLQTQERFKSYKIRYVYTAALGAIGKDNRPVEALNLFYSMLQNRSSYPDIVVYHSIAVTLGQAGHMKELLDVIDTMRSLPRNFKNEDFEDWDPRLEPDIVIYNSVLNACVQRKEWEGAFWVLQKLAEMDQQPSSTTYGLLMEVMLACGKYDLVHEFFRQMKKSSVPNALTYRVLVKTYWREGKPEEAIEAVQEMENQGLIGPASLYYDLARCLCSAGRCEEALMQVDKICKVATKPLVVTYTGLIQACLDSGKIEDGAFIFNHMQKYCSPNLVICNIMLKGYLGHGMFTEAKQLFQKMIQSGPKGSRAKGRIAPDLHTFNLMLEAYVREKLWDEFEYTYEQMLQHGYSFNAKRHLWMVLQASGAGKVEVVETTWIHLMQASSVPPPKLVKERFRLKLGNDDVMAAVSTVSSHPSSHQQSFSKEAWTILFQEHADCFKKEALEQLMREMNVCMSNSEFPNLIYQNLLHSCAEFVRFDKSVAGSMQMETLVSV